MKNWLQRIGVVLMVFAFVVLFLFIIFPAVLPSFGDVPIFKTGYQALFCKSGETLNDEHDTYNPRPGETDTTVTLSCVDNEGNARDVSSAPIGIGIVGYLVPFLGGMAIWSIGNGRNKPSADQYVAMDSTNFTSYTPSGSNALSARLRELKGALDSGMITQAEYETKRKEIIEEV